MDAIQRPALVPAGYLPAQLEHQEDLLGRFHSIRPAGHGQLFQRPPTRKHAPFGHGAVRMDDQMACGLWSAACWPATSLRPAVFFRRPRACVRSPVSVASPGLNRTGCAMSYPSLTK